MIFGSMLSVVNDESFKNNNIEEKNKIETANYIIPKKEITDITKNKIDEYEIFFNEVKRDIHRRITLSGNAQLFLPNTSDEIKETIIRITRGNFYDAINYRNFPELDEYSKYLNEDIIFSYTLTAKKTSDTLIYRARDSYVLVPSENILFRVRNIYSEGGELFGSTRVWRDLGFSKAILDYEDALLLIINDIKNCRIYWWNNDASIIIENQTEQEILNWAFRSNIDLNKIQDTCGVDQVFIFKISDIIKEHPIKIKDGSRPSYEEIVDQYIKTQNR